MKNPTASIAPSMLSVPNPHWSKTGSNLSTYICASRVGPLLAFKEKTGGLSCAKRIAARESHAAVSWRCAAKHTSSKSGPAGNDIRVISVGREVIDLNKSLNAYYIVNISVTFKGMGWAVETRTHIADPSINRPQLHYAPYSCKYRFSQLRCSGVLSGQFDLFSFHLHIQVWFILENWHALKCTGKAFGNTWQSF